jgi:glycosyltransferase involved in cell wall biosynthesis
MVARKQQALLVAGAAPLVREGAWLTLVGDGPLRTALEDQVADLGIGDRTRFTGMRQDVPAVLSALDVFASLATEEMYGLAPVEGLASGLPVVVVHCPPLLGSGPPRVRWAQPTATSVTDALRAALAQPPGRTGMDELLRERHDVRVTVATLDALYERLLGGSSQGHG